MTPVFGYIRVSTAKQGEGVSLVEQKDAIARYAEQRGLTVTQWFEEKETAAKRGRPVFGAMLKKLRRDKAAGLVVHKIDRSARNLRDWADLAELMDTGIPVHFAHESLDLSTRGGRLSADLQAVVASDYIRNLSEETKKGHRGRLKQGLYPFPAPMGYENTGRGQVKTIHPVQGPLIRRAFELYATGRYSLQQLAEVMYGRGLRTSGGKRVFKSRLAELLREPFYAGSMRLKTTGETFPGKHESLVSQALFAEVGKILDGKTVAGKSCHDYLFRKLFTCGHCSRFLVGERQKGRVYYRCHTQGCASRSAREDRIEKCVRQSLNAMRLHENDFERVEERLAARYSDLTATVKQERRALVRSLGKITGQLERLLRAFLDGAVDQETYRVTRERLQAESQKLKNRQQTLASDARGWEAIARATLELFSEPLLSYEKATKSERRKLIRTVSSNRTLTGKELAVTLADPFSSAANSADFSNESPLQNGTRTLEQIDSIVEAIWKSARGSTTTPTSSSLLPPYG